MLAQISSVTAAVYYPLYLSYTKKWDDSSCPSTPVRVSLNELKDMFFFLNAPSGIEPFLRFLHSEFSAELLFLWRDIEDFTKELDPSEQKIKAKTILADYFDPEGNKYLHDSAVFLESLQSKVEEVTVSSAMFSEVKAEVEKRLLHKFNRFLTSPTYHQYACGMTLKESLMELGWQN